VVKSFPSVPEEMALVPEDKFMLAANAVQEINAGVQPSKTGTKHYYLNVVDLEMSSLVYSWFINVNCKPPVVSKSFELTLPVSHAGTVSAYPSQKRVSYTNPYSTERVFLLSTNRDDLLSFKERRIKFMANEQKTLALKFLPNPLTGFVEIYVFINNESDTNEETFAMRVHYVKHISN
jgi:nephrocystin-4